MAQVLLCPEGSGCGECRACRLTERRSHPDLRILQLPADRRNIPIRDVHDFIQGMSLRPLEADRKVYIVDGADLLWEDGANAFLKTLEEPPPAVNLILTAGDPARLLPTIVSRCHRIALRPVGVEPLAEHLAERAGVDSESARAIAEASNGLPGWAVAAAEDPALMAARTERQRDVGHLVRADRLERLRYADALAERWSGHNDEVLDVLDTWIDTWRAVARPEAASGTKTAPNAAFLRAGLSTPPGAATAMEAARLTLDALEALKANAHPKLTLETLLLSWPHAEGASHV